MADKKVRYEKGTPTIFDYAILGKVPPQDVEIEKSVLGALLIQSDAIYDVIEILTEASFYDPRHQIIYRAIVRTNYECKPIDIMTISNKLREMDEIDNVGGEVYLVELTDKLATASHIVFHARIVHQMFSKREFIRMSAEIQKRAYDNSVELDELIEYSELSLYNITDVIVSVELKKADEIAAKCVGLLEKRSKSGDRLIGIPTGFSEIDRITGGFQSPDLIIIAARPAMGKSAFAVGIGRNMAIDFNKSVAIFSLEMSSVQTMDRIIISDSEVDGNNYKTGQLSDSDWTRVESAIENIEKAKLFIDETPAISIFELRSKCRKLKRQHGLHAVIVDYLQLMTAGSEFKGNREGEVSFISRSLKGLAKELDVPVIALSQLNRAVESRGGDKRPQLSDLRESGAIEQDADVVMFLHRPEYYGMTEDSDGNSLKGVAEVIVSKYRNGETGIVKLRFIKSLIKFADKYSCDTVEKYNEIINPELNSDIEPNFDFETTTEAPF